MNCANHPEVPVSAYCQNCGKPLCQECVRSVGGVIYCEPCLAARLQGGAGSTTTGFRGGKVAAGPVYMGVPAAGGPNPGLALGLGFIPGVGAMYNGQFVKGLVHVFVFALLCSFAAHQDFFGWMIPFWIAYQVFDAYQTAKARQDGTPLPNPFGLNDLGYRLGLQPHPEGTHPAAGTAAPPPYTPSYTPGAPGFSAAQGTNPPAAPFTSPGTQPPADPAYSSFVPPASAPGFAPGNPPPFTPLVAPAFIKNDVPVGAIVLIGLGVLFLLGSLGIFHDDWIGRSWPLLIVAVGVWLVIRRTREVRPISNGKDSL